VKTGMSNGEELEIARESRGDAMILSPQGEIDLSCAPALRTHLSEALRDHPPKLIIDLTDVPYMDSSGVATFVEAMQLARSGSSKLILCNMQERVRSIFEIARLDMVFKIVENTEDAMAV
jgi:anti-sigma B factor antagonist